MITTKRTNDVENRNASSNVDLLERKTPDSYQEFTGVPVENENEAQAKERMQKNLEKLLNYDRYSETQVQETSEVSTKESVLEETACEDEDIRPTSTTMQFGNDSIDEVYNDLDRQNEKYSYKLNTKGKVALLLYSLAIVVMLSLIVLNTGIISALSKSNMANSQLLSARQEEYNVITSELENVSSSEYIMDIAQNDYGMIIK